MALRAVSPVKVEKRLKLFLFGQASAGKTTAAIQMPTPYIIDAEKGTDHYAALINKSGGKVFQTTDIAEVIREVRELGTAKHDFKTLVIDPITPLYNNLLDECEQTTGSDFGRHYGAANKIMKRLVNLVMATDMNVIVTAHAKAEYGKKLEIIGRTFDAWKSMDYLFDLVLELSRDGKRRIARVVKTRLASFGEDDKFEWSMEELRKRAGNSLDREAKVMELATEGQVAMAVKLAETIMMPEGTVSKWFTKAGVEAWADMDRETIDKCIKYLRDRLPAESTTTEKKESIV